MRRRILVVAVLCGLLTCTGAIAAKGPDDLTGLYVANGVKPDGSAYEVLVEITRLNDAYQLRWMVDAHVIAIGMGIRDGGVLAVAYFADVPGIASYRIESDTRLAGNWTVADAGGALFSETLTKLAQDPEPLQRRPRSPNRRAPARHGTVSISLR